MTSIWLLQIYIKNFSNSVPKKNIPSFSGYFNIELYFYRFFIPKPRTFINKKATINLSYILSYLIFDTKRIPQCKNILLKHCLFVHLLLPKCY